STTAPSMTGARMLNNVSRSLSDVGLNPCQSGSLSLRPFSEPLMIRMTQSRIPFPAPRPYSLILDPASIVDPPVPYPRIGRVTRPGPDPGLKIRGSGIGAGSRMKDQGRGPGMGIRD